MLDALYLFFRGASGFALVVIGIAFLIETGGRRVRRSYGALNLAVGLAFCVSALDPEFPLQIDLGNAVIANLMLVASQSTYEMMLFIFGGHKRRGVVKRVFRFGLAWTQVVWVLPLLDGLLGLPQIGTSVEDGNGLGPIHMVASYLQFAWPVIVYVLTIRHSRWRLSDLPPKAHESKYVIRMLQVICAVVVLIIAGILWESELLYRSANCLIQILMIAWFWLTMRNPQVLVRIRREVKENHERRAVIDQGEAAIIAERLAALVADEVYRRPDLNVALLARLVRIPPYRLSRYFSEQQNTTFPAWQNQLRIGWVCRHMERFPDSLILELAGQAGYGSKTTFNSQFFRVTGMSPREFLKKATKAGTS